MDRTKSRNLDWASNIVVVKLKGNFNTEAESACLYRLCRAWWQRRTQINDLGAHAIFDVVVRDDGRYLVSLHLRGEHVQHAANAVAGSIPLPVSNPSEWEDAGLRLLDVSVAALSGEPVDASSIHLEYLTRSHRPI